MKEFNDKTISQNLGTKIIGKKIFFFKSIKSTMDYARSLAERGEEDGTVVIADNQTKGRGRFGRIWKAEPGKNILMSIILKPQIPVENFGILNFMSAVSVAEAIEKNLNLNIKTKWPNDLLINNKKFCGILLEASISAEGESFVILGIGVNVNQTRFPKELEKNATSLAIETGKELDRLSLTQDILRSLETDYIELHRYQNFESIMNRWKSRCEMLGKEIAVLQGKKIIKGKAIDVLISGALVVETESGTTKVHAGDVTVLK